MRKSSAKTTKDQQVRAEARKKRRAARKADFDKRVNFKVRSLSKHIQTLDEKLSDTQKSLQGSLEHVAELAKANATLGNIATRSEAANG